MPSNSTWGSTPKVTTSTTRALAVIGEPISTGVSSAPNGPDRPASKVSVNTERSPSVSVTLASRSRAVIGPGSGSGMVGPARTVRRAPRADTAHTSGTGTTSVLSSAWASTRASGSSAALASQIRQKPVGSPR